MGQRAQELLKKNSVEVIVGAYEADPEKVVNDYLNNSLRTGSNICTCNH